MDRVSVAARQGVRSGNASWNLSWTCEGLVSKQVEQQKVAPPWFAPTFSAENSFTGFVIHMVPSPLLKDRIRRSHMKHVSASFVKLSRETCPVHHLVSCVRLPAVELL